MTPPVPTPEDLVARWNAIRTLPKVETLDAGRRIKYAKALETHPDLNEWERAILWLNRQSWANAPGTGEHGNWRATLDWLAKPGKLAEKLELVNADLAAPPRKGGRHDQWLGTNKGAEIADV